ncbi:hypothetical protein [Sinomonas sp. RB5]
MAFEPLDVALAYFEASQEEGAADPEVAGRFGQARTVALLSIAESLSVVVAAAVEGLDEDANATCREHRPP